MIDALLEKYGQEIRVLDEAGALLRTVKGFVQLLAQSDTDALWEQTPGGGVRREKYLLIAGSGAFSGTGEERFAEKDGLRYAVLRADRLDAIRGAAHWEAILRREEVEGV